MTLPFEIDMSDYEYDVKGAPVVYTNRAPQPHNPLNRPNISFIKPTVALIVCIVANVLLGILAFKSDDLFDCVLLSPKTICIFMWILFNILYTLLITKRAIIWLVHLYQKFAPDEVRLKCVFEPSCSEYMIAAVQKYGVIKGVVKGVDRLLRCHPPNGGHDEP